MDRLSAGNLESGKILFRGVAESEPVQPAERDFNVGLFVQIFHPDPGVLFRERGGKQKRGDILRRLPVDHRLPARHRSLDRERTFSILRRGLDVQIFQGRKQMPHRTGSKRSVPVEGNREGEKRRKSCKNFDRRPGIRHIDRFSRIEQFSSGPCHTPAGVVPAVDRSAEQRCRPDRRHGILGKKRRMNPGDPVRHHSHGDRSNCMGFGTGDSDFSGEVVRADNQIHFLKILPSVFIQF